MSTGLGMRIGYPTFAERKIGVGSDFKLLRYGTKHSISKLLILSTAEIITPIFRSHDTRLIWLGDSIHDTVPVLTQPYRLKRLTPLYG